MAEMIFTRIDSRLIHGQIYSQWCRYCGCTMIVVANDETAASNFKQGLMDMAVPSAIETRYWSLNETAIRIKDLKSDEKIFLIVEKPGDLVHLINAGLKIDQVNIGNMQLEADRHQVTPTIAVNQDDINAFRQLKELGVKMEIKNVPSAAPEDIELLFQELK